MSEEQKKEQKTVERELIISSRTSEVDIALLEDKVLIELHKEKTNNQFSVGDVYLGRVKKILPGLNATFRPGYRGCRRRWPGRRHAGSTRCPAAVPTSPAPVGSGRSKGCA